MQTYTHAFNDDTKTPHYVTYSSVLDTVVQFKQLCVADRQNTVHQHVQSGELAL